MQRTKPGEVVETAFGSTAITPPALPRELQAVGKRLPPSHWPVSRAKQKSIAANEDEARAETPAGSLESSAGSAESDEQVIRFSSSDFPALGAGHAKRREGMAMKIGTPILVMLFATTTLFGDGTSNVRSDVRKLRELVRKSPYFDYLLTGTTKRYGSAYDGGQPAKLSEAASASHVDGEATLPAGWGRRLEGNPVRNTSIIVVGDTATVTCVTDVDATLYVDRSFDGIKNPGAKPIADTVTRYSTWIKQNGKWRINEVSVAQVNLRDVGRQTVHVTEVKVTVNGQAVLDVTDPTLKYDIDAGLVHVKNGDAVTIEAAVTNTSNTGWVPQTYLYCHPNRPEGGRDLMYDDGTNGDLVPGDGTWTYQYSVNLQPGPHHAAIDALDSQCLQNEMDDDYNSAAWGMPYIVDP